MPPRRPEETMNALAEETLAPVPEAMPLILEASLPTPASNTRLVGPEHFVGHPDNAANGPERCDVGSLLRSAK